MSLHISKTLNTQIRASQEKQILEMSLWGSSTYRISFTYGTELGSLGNTEREEESPRFIFEPFLNLEAQQRKEPAKKAE